MKKLLSALLSILMAVTLATTVSAEVTVTDETTLVSAIAGDELIKLENDIVIKKKLTISRSLTIDLNGKTIRLENGARHERKGILIENTLR